MQTATQLDTQPLLHPVPPAGQEDRVNQVFSAIKERLGFIPDGLRLYGISPPLLESFVANVGYFMGETQLPPELTTMIRYLVSAQAGCQFCIDMNERFLLQQGHNLDDVRAARSNPDKAPLDDRQKSLLKLALQAIDDPESVNASDLDGVRNQGWTDRDIFDAVVQAANNRAFNFVLRTFKVEAQGVFA